MAGMRGRFHSAGSPRPWQAILFSPVGDGRRRRRASDGVRLGMAALGVLLCWLATHADSHAEQVVATTLASPPDGLRWLVTSLWWATSAGLVVILVLLAALGRRWTAFRDVAVSASPPGCSAFWPSPCSAPMAAVPPTTRSAGSTSASPPCAWRWPWPSAPPSSRRWPAGCNAPSAWPSSSSHSPPWWRPTACRWRWRPGPSLGWGATALVRLVFGSPLGLPSSAEMTQLLADLDLAVTEVVANPAQRWGVARYAGRLGHAAVDVSLYGRDASDAQLLTKTARFLFYRDSGPTLALTATSASRARGVPHAHGRSGRRPCPRRGRRRAGGPGPRCRAGECAAPRPSAVDPSCQMKPVKGQMNQKGRRAAGCEGHLDHPDTAAADGNGRAPADDVVLDDLFTQILRLRAGRIAHGAISPETVVLDPSGQAGLVDFRMASAAAGPDQLDRDMAAGLATAALVVGPDRSGGGGLSSGAGRRPGRRPSLRAAGRPRPRGATRPPREQGGALDPAHRGGGGRRRGGAQAHRAPTHQLGQPAAGRGHPGRGVGPHRSARQRDQVVEHDHRGQVGMGGHRLRAGPGRLPRHRRDHGGLGDRSAALRAHVGPRAGRHLRGPGRGIDGRARHPGPVLPKGGLQRDPGRVVGRARLDGQLDRQGRPLPRLPSRSPSASCTSPKSPTSESGSHAKLVWLIVLVVMRCRPPPRRRLRRSPLAAHGRREAAAQGVGDVGTPPRARHPPAQPHRDLRRQPGRPAVRGPGPRRRPCTPSGTI